MGATFCESVSVPLSIKSQKLTACTKSPAASIYALMTCGVTTLLVGSSMASGATSTGRSWRVSARTRLIRSGSQGEDIDAKRQMCYVLVTVSGCG